MFGGIQSKWLVVDEHVSVSNGVPVLAPKEVTLPGLGEVVLPGIVNSLDDGATVDARQLQQIRYCGAMPKRIYRPTGFHFDAEVIFDPLVTWK